MTMKFSKGVDHQNVTSSVTSVVLSKNTCKSVTNGHIIMKFRTWIAHEWPILHSKQNSEIYTDVIDDDVFC